MTIETDTEVLPHQTSKKLSHFPELLTPRDPDSQKDLGTQWL